TFDAFLYGGEIGHGQFGVEAVEIAVRVDISIDVRDVAIGKGAQYDGKGIGIANMPKEFGAQSFALLFMGLGCLSHTGDVYKLDGCGCDFLWFEYVRERLETGVRDLDNSDICLYCACGVSTYGCS